MRTLFSRANIGFKVGESFMVEFRARRLGSDTPMRFGKISTVSSKKEIGRILIILVVSLSSLLERRGRRVKVKLYLKV